MRLKKMDDKFVAFGNVNEEEDELDEMIDELDDS